MFKISEAWQNLCHSLYSAPGSLSDKQKRERKKLLESSMPSNKIHFKITLESLTRIPFPLTQLQTWTQNIAVHLKNEKQVLDLHVQTFRSSCFGIMVILFPSMLRTVPFKFAKSPSATSTTSPVTKVCLSSSEPSLEPFGTTKK